MVGNYLNDGPLAEDTDQWAIYYGNVAITSMCLEETAYEMMETISNWNL